jgi:hypothetical protein
MAGYTVNFTLSIGGMMVKEEENGGWEGGGPVSQCPPQIPEGLAWDRKRVSEVRGWRITNSAKETPAFFSFGNNKKCIKHTM